MLPLILNLDFKCYVEFDEVTINNMFTINYLLLF